MRFLLLTFFIVSLASTVFAQESWSLERCIKSAQESNITIQQAQLVLRNAQLDTKLAKAARNPSLSANVSGGGSFGRSIDQTSNAFVNKGFGYNGLGLDAGVSLFQGGLINHNIKQSRHQVQAAQADLESAANDVGLFVAQAYLNILLAEEQVKNAQNRMSQTLEQLKNTRKFIAVGTLPAVDSLNVVAQIARDEQVLIGTQNTLDLAYLSLRQLLQIEPEKSFKIENPMITIPEEAYLSSVSMRDVYSTALTTQPSIRAGESRLRAAHEGVSIAKAGLFPTLSLFAQLNSNYSTQYKENTGTDVRLGGGIPVVVTDPTGNAVPVSIQFLEPIPVLRTVPYAQQHDETFRQGIGVNLNIPIYQNGRTHLNIQRSKLNIKSVELQNEQTKQALKSDIQTALANARAGNKQYKASLATFAASKLAYENMQKRYTLGAVNALDLTTARNNLTLAENDVTVARYDYIFKVKILDFYLGKKIKLN
jgi:outer membrane protein